MECKWELWQCYRWNVWHWMDGRCDSVDAGRCSVEVRCGILDGWRGIVDGRCDSMDVTRQSTRCGVIDVDCRM